MVETALILQWQGFDHHICVLESLLEECTNVIGGAISRLDIVARRNINMGADGSWEGSSDTVLWLASNGQFELP